MPWKDHLAKPRPHATVYKMLIPFKGLMPKIHRQSGNIKSCRVDNLILKTTITFYFRRFQEAEAMMGKPKRRHKSGSKHK